MIIQYKFMKMHPTASIITYCINGNTFYCIPLAQLPLAQLPLAQLPLARTPLGNNNRLPTINNRINKNNINKSIPIKIITPKMVKESCANDCKWP